MMRGERAQAAPMLIVLLLAGIAFLGLAVDGTRLFMARRDLHNAVDAATLAAASELDEAKVRLSDGMTPALDPQAAREVAAETLVLAGVPADAKAEISADQNGVEVSVRRELPMIFLKVVGMPTHRVGASANSKPRIRLN